MSEIHSQLKETLLLYRQLLKARQHQEALRKRLREEADALIKTDRKVKRKEKDVENLENGGMRSFLHKMVGDRDQLLEKEREEYLQAALKYNELSKSIDLMEFELNILEKKLLDFEKVQRKYRDLMKVRERELIQSDPDIGRDLLLLHKRIDHGQVMLRDIEEAIVAGKEADKVLLAMEKELRGAYNWRSYDKSTGRYSPIHARHSAVQRAKDLSYRARHTLLLFRRELEDVYEDAGLRIDVQVEGFDRFTDILFDNFISEWLVHQRINTALTDVKNARTRVSHAMNQLEKDLPIVKKELSSYEEKRESMILQSES